MIKRIWRGWTSPENAEAYQDLLLNEVIPSIGAQRIPGYSSTEVLREDLGGEIEFSTVMSFESLESVIVFQGADYARCYVPEAARGHCQRKVSFNRPAIHLADAQEPISLFQNIT